MIDELIYYKNIIIWNAFQEHISHFWTKNGGKMIFRNTTNLNAIQVHNSHCSTKNGGKMVIFPIFCYINANKNRWMDKYCKINKLYALFGYINILINFMKYSKNDPFATVVGPKMVNTGLECISDYCIFIVY